MNHYCQQASRLVSDRLDRDLTLRERLHLWLHLAMCNLCRRNARAVSQMHHLLRDGSAGEGCVGLDAEQRRHIAEALQQKRG